MSPKESVQSYTASFVRAAGLLAVTFLLARPALAGADSSGAGKPEPVAVYVTASYPGAQAREVERLVTTPLEQVLQGLPGLDSLESVSRKETCIITAYFQPRQDAAGANKAVQKELERALAQLPDVVKKAAPTVRLWRADRPALWLVLRSPQGRFDLAYLHNLAAMRLGPEVAAVPGVVAVSPPPRVGQQLSVWLDADKLAARSLNAADVVAALRKAAARTIEEVDGIVLREDGGQKTHLRDVARLEVAGADLDHVAQAYPEPGIGLAVFARSEDVAGKTVDEVRRRLEALRRLLPEGASLEVVQGPAAPGGEALLLEGRLPDAASRERIETVMRRLVPTLQRTSDRVRAVLSLPTDPPAFRLYAPLASAPKGPSLEEVRARAGRLQQETPEALIHVEAVPSRDLPARLRAPIAIAVRGGEERSLAEAAERVVRLLSDSSLATEVWADDGREVPTLSVEVDRGKVRHLGVSEKDVMDTLQVYYGIYCEGPAKSEMVVRLGPGLRMSPEDIKALKVRNADGEMVPLGALVQVRDVAAVRSIRHLGGTRCLLVTARPANGQPAAEVRRRCRELLERAGRQALPDGCRAEVLQPASGR